MQRTPVPAGMEESGIEEMKGTFDHLGSPSCCSWEDEWHGEPTSSHASKDEHLLGMQREILLFFLVRKCCSSVGRGSEES